MRLNPWRVQLEMGGRWNPVGLPALYTSERFETAWLAAQQGSPFKTQPLTHCTYNVDCGPLLNLCDPAIQEQVHPNPKDWMHEAWLDKKLRRKPIIAWEIAAQLMEEGFTGIRLPSQAKGVIHLDINTVLWKWSQKVPTKVRVIDDEE